jgi:hypothetical protein
MANSDGSMGLPLPPEEATRRIRYAATRSEVGIGYPWEQAQALVEMGLVIGDVLHVLKRSGVVYEPGRPASRVGAFCYSMDGTSPNSGGRVVRIEVIISPWPLVIKVNRVLWRDSVES